MRLRPWVHNHFGRANTSTNLHFSLCWTSGWPPLKIMYVLEFFTALDPFWLQLIFVFEVMQWFSLNICNSVWITYFNSGSVGKFFKVSQEGKYCKTIQVKPACFPKLLSNREGDKKTPEQLNYHLFYCPGCLETSICCVLV